MGSAAAAPSPTPRRRGYARAAPSRRRPAACRRTACGPSTAASSAPVSPSCQARAHRSALRLAVAEMQPAKTPERASISTASVEGNTLKLRRYRRSGARIRHVARGILEPDDPRAEGVEQALDQPDVPRQPGLGGKVIEDRCGIGLAAVAARWSRYRRRARRPARPCSRTAAAPARRRSRARRRAVVSATASATDAAPVPTIRRSSGRPNCPIARHHALALLERERGRLAGGAEHVQSVAAIGEQKARERGRAGAIGLALVVDGGRDRRR